MFLTVVRCLFKIAMSLFLSLICVIILTRWHTIFFSFSNKFHNLLTFLRVVYSTGASQKTHDFFHTCKKALFVSFHFIFSVEGVSNEKLPCILLNKCSNFYPFSLNRRRWPRTLPSRAGTRIPLSGAHQGEEAVGSNREMSSVAG